MTGEPPQAVQGGSQNGDRVQPGSSLSAGQQGLPKGSPDSLLPPTTQPQTMREPRPRGPKGWKTSQWQDQGGDTAGESGNPQIAGPRQVCLGWTVSAQCTSVSFGDEQCAVLANL